MPAAAGLAALSRRHAADLEFEREVVGPAVPLRVLLVEDDERCAMLVRDMLAMAAPEVVLEHADRLSVGAARLADGDFAVVVTDLNLTDSHGPDTVRGLVLAAPDVPVVVVSSTRDATVALDAIGAGAGEFLVKGEFDADALARTVRAAARRGRQGVDGSGGAR